MSTASQPLSQRRGGPAVADVWQRAPESADLGPRSVIHISDAPLAQRVPGAPESPITLQPLTGEACDLTALIFTFPPNYVGKVHWHPADTLYVIRKGTFIVEGEGAFNVGDIRWVNKGT